MPRRFLQVTAIDVRRSKLDTPEGRTAWLANKLTDPADWTSALHQTRVGYVLVLDHVDPEKPMTELRALMHHGRPLVHERRAQTQTCTDCGDPPVFGRPHCLAHWKVPETY